LFSSLPDSPLPPLHLLEEPQSEVELQSAETLDFTSRLIERKLMDFGIEVKVVTALPGPVITRYELEPAAGVKGSQVANLSRDLARA
jgi:S-DNA-T family DNA segregation ATPase FtsK/SpoIIIE